MIYRAGGENGTNCFHEKEIIGKKPHWSGKWMRIYSAACVAVKHGRTRKYRPSGGRADECFETWITSLNHKC